MQSTGCNRLVAQNSRYATQSQLTEAQNTRSVTQIQRKVLQNKVQVTHSLYLAYVRQEPTDF